MNQHSQCVSLMDYEYSPIVRKVPRDRIRILLFKNGPGFKILDFVKSYINIVPFLKDYKVNMKTTVLEELERNNQLNFKLKYPKTKTGN